MENERPQMGKEKKMPDREKYARVRENGETAGASADLRERRFSCGRGLHD